MCQRDESTSLGTQASGALRGRGRLEAAVLSRGTKDNERDFRRRRALGAPSSGALHELQRPEAKKNWEANAEN